MKKKESFLSFVKGAITGIGTLLPGISSGALLVSLSTYENFVESLRNIFKKNNKGLYLVVIPLILGLIAGLIGGVHLTSYFLEKFRPQTVFLFIGLIAGGYMLTIRKHKIKARKKSALLFLTVFIVTILLYIFCLDNISIGSGSSIFSLILSGILTGLAILVPGLAASNLYQFLGNYEYILSSLKNISSVSNFITVLIFIITILVTIILLARLIYYLLKKHKEISYIVIAALLASSVVLAILELDKFTINFVNIFTSILTFLWGYIFAKNVEKE